VTVRDEAAAEDGLPLAVKDLFDTAGLRTTYGSGLFADHVPKRTASAVLRLEDAGCVVVGKTGLHEFAYGITSENEHFGDVRNPLDPGRRPGGTSGGSAAALAAGLADAALGTDSGGSIRIPAACCGVVGLKPTFGRVPLDGVFPLAPSFDHAGPMARTVAECVPLAAALDPGLELPQVGLGDLRAGVAWTELAAPLVRARVEEAAARLGAVEHVAFPFPEGVDAVFMREAADVHRERFAEHPDRYGTNVRAKLERCLAVTDETVEAALAARKRYRETALEALGDLDLLLAPTLTHVAPPVGIPELELREEAIRLTFPFNTLGWPVLALPCGPAEDGLPASVSVVARPGADGLVLAAGLGLERDRSPV
jgi:aspartyl-tRNA(Asn)/glutamyl-tRNA(Gln) amidotransferase subunit A